MDKHTKVIPVKISETKMALIAYYQDELGNWISVLDNQAMTDLLDILDGKEPSSTINVGTIDLECDTFQEYVATNTGDIPPWVTL